MTDNLQSQKGPLFGIALRTFAHNNLVIDPVIRDIIGKSYIMGYASPITARIIGKTRPITMKITVLSPHSHNLHVL